ncbi:MAG TPA: endonuclease III, partial [Casimicrobium sp.]|nr:endonuclease III [Casimicrobium sp.]
MNAEKRHRIYATLAKANPNPKTELEFGNPFQLLIAVLLSAQATDKSVNAATRRFFPTVKTPADLLAMGEANLADTIKTIGLFRNKAKNAIATAQQLITLHGGEVPHDRAALEALPGVGRKTANVVLNEAFGDATLAVDTHVFRVANRMKLAPGKTVDEVERKLMKFTPP